MFKRIIGVSAVLAGLAMASPASAQDVKWADGYSAEEVAQFEKRCSALNRISLEQAADLPAQIVSAKLAMDRKTAPREDVMFMKRGHVHGLPTPRNKAYPPHCYVEGYASSHIRFAMMLPASPQAWNERFLLSACDGLCGAVHDNALAPGLHYGFATITNNGGHYSRAPFDSIWGYNDRAAEINFGYRANHVTAQIGKAIAEAYYGRKPSYSYLVGFSRGGTAGIIAAQRYPEDFDGIFSKAPVIHYNDKNNIAAPFVARGIYPEGETAVMDSSKVHIVADAVMKACDGLDGLEDGIIEDPRICKFEPASLLCKPGEAESTCLTQPQVHAIETLYAVPTSNGEVIYPVGNNYGSEGDWPRFMFPEPNSDNPGYLYWIARGSLRYLAFENDPGPDYDWRDFDPVADRDKIAFMSDIVDADSPDLRGFRDAGGKMIIMHGWADGAIAAQMTQLWFDEMAEYMGGFDAVDDFAQLYLVAGVKHGSGGQAPTEHDAMIQLMRWVEKGVEPQKIGFVDEMTVREGTPEGVEVQRSRVAYPYPDRAVYGGTGDPNAASSYVREEDYFLGEPGAPPFASER